MKRQRWLTFLLLIAALVRTVSAATHCPGNIASVPLRYVNRYQIIVSVSVNHSRPYDFLLDTGSQLTILDRSVAADLHLGTSGSAALAGVGGREPASMTGLDTLSVGENAVFSPRVLVADLTEMRGVDSRIEGILGEDFLLQFDSLIDNRQRRLCLDKTGRMRTEIKGQRVTFLGAPEAPGDVRMPNPLILNVRFLHGIRPVRLKLDSGTNAPFLYSPSQYLALGAIEGSSWHGSGVNGKQQRFVALSPQDITIDGLTLSGVSFLALRYQHRGSNLAALDGLLPTGLFKRVFLSHSGEFAVLEPWT
jgi:hypothetical protein